MLGAEQQPLSRIESQVAHQALNGTGKIRFHKEMIFGVLPLSTRIPARLSVTTARLSEPQMAETAGQFKPAIQRKICGPFPSQMQLTERLSAKVAPSLGPQMEAIIGLASQAEQLFSSVEFHSLTPITELLSVKVAPFSELPMAETAGFLNRVEPRTLFSEFRLPMRTPELR